MNNFINIKGVGDININNIVMIVKGINGKYELILTHGGRIEVSKTMRDKILGHGEIIVSVDSINVDPIKDVNPDDVKFNISWEDKF